MTKEDQILSLFDKYFESTSKEELIHDVDTISSYGTEGISFESYINVLNSVTSFSLADTGICDDLAFSDFFNNSISRVKMGNNRIPEASKIILIDFNETIGNQITAGESNYAQAA